MEFELIQFFLIHYIHKNNNQKNKTFHLEYKKVPELMSFDWTDISTCLFSLSEENAIMLSSETRDISVFSLSPLYEHWFNNYVKHVMSMFILQAYIRKHTLENVGEEGGIKIMTLKIENLESSSLPIYLIEKFPLTSNTYLDSFTRMSANRVIWNLVIEKESDVATFSYNEFNIITEYSKVNTIINQLLIDIQESPQYLNVKIDLTTKVLSINNVGIKFGLLQFCIIYALIKGKKSTLNTSEICTTCRKWLDSTKIDDDYYIKNRSFYFAHKKINQKIENQLRLSEFIKYEENDKFLLNPSYSVTTA